MISGRREDVEERYFSPPAKYTEKKEKDLRTTQLGDSNKLKYDFYIGLSETGKKGLQRNTKVPKVHFPAAVPAKVAPNLTISDTMGLKGGMIKAC